MFVSRFRKMLRLLFLFGMLVFVWNGCGEGSSGLGGEKVNSDGASTALPESNNNQADAAVSTCGQGTTLCDGQCSNIRRDHKHCGKCDNPCKSDEACMDGRCSLVCANGQTKCGDACVNLTQDGEHCGRCDNKCALGQVCSSGTCSQNCSTGRVACGGGCVALQTNVNHCGKCNKNCNAGETCKEGKCVVSCAPGFTNCSGKCVNTKVDHSHCGKCGNRCPSRLYCSAGTCSSSCPTGYTDCSGSCIDLQSDGRHCGACNSKCKASEICSKGKCILNCPPGFTECKGVCVNLKTERAHCGACGVVCKSSEVCSNGKCALTCQTGLTLCSGSCVILKTDLLHCGACNNKCKAGETCSNGKCEPVQCELFTFGNSARPIDIIFVVDQSSSMVEEINNVKKNLNGFSSFISTQKIDYHVVMVAQKGSGSHDICIQTPLGGANCTDGPRYKQVDHFITSENPLLVIQSEITAIESFLRKGSLRHFIAITDDDSILPARDFNTWLKKRPGYQDYVFHSIVGLRNSTCADAKGKVYQALSLLTGGSESNICTTNWSSLFNQLGKAVTSRAIAQYKLQKAPQLNTMQVQWDGKLQQQGTNWTYDIANQQLVLKGTFPKVGTKIKACYLSK